MATGKKKCNNKIIGIGGTGMRCVEAFVYMCAVGMFPGKEFQIFLLETDNGNGNFQRVLEAIKFYREVKGGDGRPNPDGFFSASILEPEQINLVYNNEGVGFHSYREILESPAFDDDTSEENQILANLLLDKGVQNYDLLHGYRAKPHLGSFLMYNFFVTEAKKQNPEIFRILNYFSLGDKVFLMGSVFGGTGASSIPVLPRALEEAYRLIDESHVTKLSDMVDFGAVLLTSYFDFNVTPNQTNEVVAKANSFLINSQLALQYYEDDPYVKKAFKSFYHIGWPLKSPTNFNGANKKGKANTGGSSQTNPSHVIELLTVSAANHFFFGNQNPDVELETTTQNGVNHHYLWLNKVSERINPKVEDLVLMNPTDFRNNLFAFTSLSLLLYQNYRPAKSDKDDNTGDFTGLLNKLKMAKKFNMPQKMQTLFEHLGSKNDYTFKQRIHALNELLANFLVRCTNDNILIEGWLRQVQSSTGLANFLEYNPDVFGSHYSLMSLPFGDVPESLDMRINSQKGNFLQKLFVGHKTRQINMFFDKLRELSGSGEDSGVQREDILEYTIHYVYKALAATYDFE